MALSAVVTPPLDAAPLRAAIYTRISSDDDARIKGLGVARQEKACRALVEVNDWALAGVYTDNNASASKVKTTRPNYDRLLGDIAAGAVDRVVVLAQDRLVRKPDELEGLLRVLRSRGIREITTVTDGTVNIGALAGRLMSRVKGAFDIYYAEYISEKVSQKKDELAELGVPDGGGTRPFGYERDGVTVNEAEAALIREAAARILDGEGLITVCRDWEQRGVSTVTGRRWLPNVLRGILSSPRVVGLRQHRGEIVGNATWSAILDRDQWERLQVVFARRKGIRTNTNRALLTGLLKCGRCGEQLWHGVNNGKPAYFCRKAVGFTGCGGLAVIGEPVEKIIVDAVLQALDTPNLAQVVEAQGEDRGGDLAAIEAQLADLAAMWGAGEIDRPQWMAAKRPLDQRLADARGRLEGAVVESVLAPYRGAPGFLREAWPLLSAAQRQAILAATIEKVVIGPVVIRGRHSFDPARITITWRG